MDSLKKYYEILGLEEKANSLRVKQAFRELAFQFHPDRNPHNPQAEEKFKQIAQAYAVLSGNQEMFLALETRQSATHEAKRFVQDIFGDIFDIDLQKTPPKILSDWEIPCDTCAGTGSAFGTTASLCTYCFGQGHILVGAPQTKSNPSTLLRVKKQCPKCLGRGKISLNPCHKCRGRGVLKRSSFTFDGARNLCEILSGFIKKLRHFFLGS